MLKKTARTDYKISVSFIIAAFSTVLFLVMYILLPSYNTVKDNLSYDLNAEVGRAISCTRVTLEVRKTDVYCGDPISICDSKYRYIEQELCKTNDQRINELQTRRVVSRVGSVLVPVFGAIALGAGAYGAYKDINKKPNKNK